MKALLTTLTTIMAFGLLAVSMPVLAQTPDGDTPAQETVCDPLKEDGVTKGLYGLCVAFCEAYDAADEDTPITEDQLSDILALSPNGRILKNYNKKKDRANNPNDPDMPCVRMEPCPCWTTAEIDSIDGILPDGYTGTVTFGTAQYPQCEESGRNIDGYSIMSRAASYDNFFGPDSGVCQALEYDDLISTGFVRYVTLWYYGDGDTNNTLTLEQRDACTAQVMDCIDRNTP